jgi:DNA-directed RNA polymerase II subunit RPB11
MNAPESYELFVLPEGQKKVSIEKDTKLANTSTFIIRLEDHTLGNLLCATIQEQKHVLFCGYKVPHPLTCAVHLRIQTTDATTPEEVFQHALNVLTGHVNALEDTFKSQVLQYARKNHYTIKEARFH